MSRLLYDSVLRFDVIRSVFIMLDGSEITSEEYMACKPDMMKAQRYYLDTVSRRAHEDADYHISIACEEIRPDVFKPETDLLQ